VTSPSEDIAAWTKEFGKEASVLIQKNVEDNMDDFLYLKQFALKPKESRREEDLHLSYEPRI
jgi:hypothetical protein